MGEEESEEEAPYMLIIDAGSSGTRVHVYEFNGQTSKLSPGLVPLKALKHKPGLSACAKQGGRAACAKKHIETLLKEVSDTVFEAAMTARPKVYLLATGGLRLLKSTDTREILLGAGQGIKAAGFREGTEPRVASGTDEAIFDWLSVNLAGSSTILPRVTRSRNPPTPIGVVDLGGASMQVAFVARDFPDVYTPIKLPLQLGDHELYAVSRLRFGLDVAYSAVVDGPTDACSIEGGHGDFEACNMHVKTYIAKYQEHSSVVNMEPPPGVKLVLVDNLYKALAHVLFHVADDITGLNVIITSCETLPFACDHAYSPTLRQLYLAGSSICTANWQELKQLNEKPGGVSEDKLRKTCFATAYVISFLTNIMNVDFDDRRLYVPNRFGENDASWAYGAAAFYAMKPHQPNSAFFQR